MVELGAHVETIHILDPGPHPQDRLGMSVIIGKQMGISDSIGTESHSCSSCVEGFGQGIQTTLRVQDAAEQQDDRQGSK